MLHAIEVKKEIGDGSHDTTEARLGYCACIPKQRVPGGAEKAYNAPISFRVSGQLSKLRRQI